MNTASKIDSSLIGAHTSIAGGLHNALYKGAEIGASTVQIFTSNQKQWKGRCYTDEDIALWQKAKEETGIQTVMSHASYLINLASPREEVHEKSLVAFSEELKRCHALDIKYLNFHPGSRLQTSSEEGLNKIISSLLKLKKEILSGNTHLLFEATAGQGSTLGATFEELGYLVKALHNEIPIGVCIDTCHIFAAGYDIRTPKGWKQTLKEFDTHVGLQHLYALHINDSKMELGSKKDRHASLGKGEIGLSSFRFISKDAKLCSLPKYLETPDGSKNWKKEIAWLKAPQKTVL